MITALTVLFLGAMGMGTIGSGASGPAGDELSGGLETGYLFRTLEHDGETYRYAVYVPRKVEQDDGEGARGLLFLHGRGECGTDGSRPLAVGLPPAMMLEPGRWPFVVVIPQKPDHDEEWEDHAPAVLAMLDAAIDEHGIARDRVAITGLSQGGHGTIWFASNHGDRFRAAAPVCGYVGRWWQDHNRGPLALPEGGEAEAFANSFRGTPVWLLHGRRDSVVPPNQSEWLHSALKAAGLDSRLTIFPNDNHNSWDSAYRESGLWTWLIEKTR